METPFVYRGWEVYYDKRNPVSGRWFAVRFGVAINTNSSDGICSMIDQRIKDYPPKGD